MLYDVIDNNYYYNKTTIKIKSINQSTYVQYITELKGKRLKVKRLR